MRRGARLLRSPAWRLPSLALALAAAVSTAACGPPEPAHPEAPIHTPHAQQAPNVPAVLMAPTATPHIQRASSPEWRVPPSIEEQIFFSDVIARATLQSATAAVETLPGDPGVAPTYLAVQELRFTVHEYLQGSGPTSLLVVVRGTHAYLTEAGARTDAGHAVELRVTTWDDRQAVVFLETPTPPYASTAWQFVLSNYDQSPWAYSVDTLSRAWLPAENIPAAGVTPTAFITDGTLTPPPTITLSDLRAQVAAMAAELQAGGGIAGFRDCILTRIGHSRHRRAVPWTPPQEAATLGSGSAAITDVSREAYRYREPQYSRYWLSGSDSSHFRPLVIDADGAPGTGYDHALATTRPLPNGTYHVRYNWQHPSEIPCGFAPDDTFDDFTVTVTAPAGTVHEAFFDPAA
ncbi:MAG: hypothetical protein OXP73_05380, partial [Chloroflexota bacterium]|nr:hypothetical protein [Chloroflexota bacterium]